MSTSTVYSEISTNANEADPKSAIPRGADWKNTAKISRLPNSCRISTTTRLTTTVIQNAPHDVNARDAASDSLKLVEFAETPSPLYQAGYFSPLARSLR